MKEWTISSMVTKSLEQVLNWYASVSFIHSVLNLFICLVSPQLIIKNLSCAKHCGICNGDMRTRKNEPVPCPESVSIVF